MIAVLVEVALIGTAVLVAGALVAGAVLTVGAIRHHREWSVDTGPILATGPEGELQDPQYAARGNSASGTDDAADTAIAVVGAGITPFINRAPLSVARTQHSQRHG